MERLVITGSCVFDLVSHNVPYALRFALNNMRFGMVLLLSSVLGLKQMYIKKRKMYS